MRERIETNTQGIIDVYTPGPGFILLRKESVCDKWGGLVLARTTTQRMQKFSGVGFIVAVSPYEPESEHDKYLSSLYQVGDLVGFSVTTPLDAPVPEWFFIQKEEEKSALLTLHVADIIAKYKKDTPGVNKTVK